MLSEPEIIKIKDKEYKVEGFTLVVQESFERMMEHDFLKLIRDNKEILQDDYLPMLQKHFIDVKNGLYKFCSANFYLFIQNEDNLIELLHWCFSKHQMIDKKELKEWMIEEPELAVNLFERLMLSVKKN